MGESVQTSLLRWINLELKEYGESINSFDRKPTFNALRRITENIVEVKQEDNDEVAVIRVLADFYGDDFIDSIQQEGERCSWQESNAVAKVVALLMNFVLTCNDHRELHVRMVMDNMQENDQTHIMHICEALTKNVDLAESETKDGWADVLREDYLASQCSPLENLQDGKQAESSRSCAEKSPQPSTSSSNTSSKSSPLSSSLSEYFKSPGLKLTAHLRLKNQEVKRLKNALKEMEYDLDCAEQKNFELSNVLNALEKELEALKRDSVTLSEQLCNKEVLIEELKEDKRNVQSKMERLEKRLKRESEARSDLQEKAIALETRCVEYSAEVKQLQQKIALLTKSESERKEKVAVMQIEHAHEIAEMSRLLKTMQIQNEHALVEQHNLKDDNAFLTNRCRELESRKDTALLFKKYVVEKLLFMKRTMALLTRNLENTEKVLADCQKLAALARATRKRENWKPEVKTVKAAELETGKLKLQTEGRSPGWVERKRRSPSNASKNVVVETVTDREKSFAGGISLSFSPADSERPEESKTACSFKKAVTLNHTSNQGTLCGESGNLTNISTGQGEVRGADLDKMGTTESSCPKGRSTRTLSNGTKKTNSQGCGFSQTNGEKKPKANLAFVLKKKLKTFIHLPKKKIGLQEQCMESGRSQKGPSTSCKTLDGRKEKYDELLSGLRSGKELERHFRSDRGYGPIATSTPRQKSAAKMTNEYAELR